MGKSSPSLRDVAQVAGVSLGTASRVLNNKSNVLPSTRALVLKAAADIGYKLQIRMPTTVVSKINTIGVAIKRDPGEFPRIDPFNYAILCGIEDECKRLGLNLMYASLPVNEYSQATTWSPLLDNEEIDGLIIVGVVFKDPEITNRIPSDISVVLVDSLANDIECDTVNIQNFRGAYNAVRYLVNQGHKHIGLIGSSESEQDHPSIRERRQGYVKALSDHGITQTYIGASLLCGDGAYTATIELLQQHPEITAIFACSDDVAVKAMRAIKDMDLCIPGNVSVMGFDDTVIGLSVEPALATMRVDKELMGILAVRHLYERAANYERPPITTLIGTKLILRDSVKQVS